ncbi:PQQ-binding-like beta-propeller repeat protein [Nocardia sp. 2]|uniref:PQQ-binding-like beta-propeller repeat protein n=1 Tax=Nocardia acididurans TaxID=2802282 RepID=A0ABS1MGC5_9NOCA|nr:PQQ-binding-like beta-propeller repeat protein [Nocardia acididurans]MBL1078744.1 PQQ-binding-like beta-propeller repeat protein [Nocardia acididurans]
MPTAGALGAGLVAGGMLLAAYSRWYAESRPLDGASMRTKGWLTDRPSVDLSALPETLATAALVAGALLLIVCAAVLLAAPHGSYRDWGPIVGLVGAGGLLTFPYLAVKYRLPWAWDELRTDHPWFAALPAAIAAGVLVTLGGVLVLRLAGEPSAFARIPRRTATVAVVAGLVVSGAVAVGTEYLGDDRRNLDHVTAARVAVPAVPDRLGVEQYRLSVPATGRAGGQTFFGDFTTAGTGFVVSSVAGITAYDGATGAPTWHYLRRTGDDGRPIGGGYIERSLTSIDGGSVILAQWRRAGWIAFDAVTGEILWRNSDFGIDAGAYEQLGTQSLDGAALVLDWRDQLRGYDPRTGALAWTAEPAVECAAHQPHRVRPVVTATTVYTFDWCGYSAEPSAAITALDARTGAVVARREIPRAAETSTARFSADLKPLRTGVAIEWNLPTPTMLVIGAPGELATAPPIEWVDSYGAVDPQTTDAVAREWVRGAGARDVVVNRTTGVAKYELPDLPSTLAYTDIALLGTQIVQVASNDTVASGDGRDEIRAWSRTDGAPSQPQPLLETAGYCRTSGLVPAPGVILGYCDDGQELELIGFRPAG